MEEEVNYIQSERKRMSRKAKLIIIILVILVVLVVGALVAYLIVVGNFDDPGSMFGGGSLPSGVVDNYVRPDYSGVIGFLESEDMINDLPSNGNIALAFYHMAENYRVFDKVYYITTGSVEEKLEDADMEIWIHSDYVNQIGQMGSNSRVSKAELLVQYGGMMGYRDCLGF